VGVQGGRRRPVGAPRGARHAEKKRAGSKARFALPAEVGRVEVACGVPEEVIDELLDSLTGPAAAADEAGRARQMRTRGRRRRKPAVVRVTEMR
jgi:hypothetical protein